MSGIADLSMVRTGYPIFHRLREGKPVAIWKDASIRDDFLHVSPTIPTYVWSDVID